jgi:hypothetical protein
MRFILNNAQRLPIIRATQRVEEKSCEFVYFLRRSLKYTTETRKFRSQLFRSRSECLHFQGEIGPNLAQPCPRRFDVETTKGV